MVSDSPYGFTCVIWLTSHVPLSQVCSFRTLRTSPDSILLSPHSSRPILRTPRSSPSCPLSRLRLRSPIKSRLCSTKNRSNRLLRTAQVRSRSRPCPAEHALIRRLSSLLRLVHPSLGRNSNSENILNPFYPTTALARRRSSTDRSGCTATSRKALANLKGVAAQLGTNRRSYRWYARCRFCTFPPELRSDSKSP